MTTLYISGPIQGFDNGNRTAFEMAVENLQRKGYNTINPHDIKPWMGIEDWHHFLRTDIRAMVLCDGIALLHDWHRSSGATVEFDLARRLAIPAEPLPYWLYERAPLSTWADTLQILED